MGEEKCPSMSYESLYFWILGVAVPNLAKGKLSLALEQSIELVWEDVSDFVNPFGDHRGCVFDTVWTFDLDNDVLFLRKRHQFCSISLELGRKRLLVLDDFERLSSPRQSSFEEQSLPGPYWEPKLDPLPRMRSFVGKILSDFAYTWRHILRRPMNTITFMKLAYATIWISTLDFTVLERTGFEHVSSRGPYVDVVDLPSWESPKATLIQVGSSCFALAQDTQEGLEMIQRHMTSHLEDSTTNLRTYAILTLQYIVLCKAQGSELTWTRSETLFSDGNTSDTAIDMILWATNTANDEPHPSAINSLPIETQNRVLYHATTSHFTSAKLGCELGVGSPFSWVDDGLQIRLQEVKRHRMESSPVESQIYFAGTMSGVSYKAERGSKVLANRIPVFTVGRA